MVVSGSLIRPTHSWNIYASWYFLKSLLHHQLWDAEVCVCKRALPEAIFTPREPSRQHLVTSVVCPLFLPEVARHLQIRLELICGPEGETEVTLALGRLWAVMDKSPTLWILETGLLSHHGRARLCQSAACEESEGSGFVLGERERSSHDAPLLFICKHSLPSQGFPSERFYFRDSSLRFSCWSIIHNTERSICVFSLSLQRSSQSLKGLEGSVLPSFFPQNRKPTYFQRIKTVTWTTAADCAHPGSTAKNL